VSRLQDKIRTNCSPEVIGKLMKARLEAFQIGDQLIMPLSEGLGRHKTGDLKKEIVISPRIFSGKSMNFRVKAWNKAHRSQ
jgi:hypothetical protein